MAEDCAPWLAGGDCAGGCGRRHRVAAAAALLCGAARRCEGWARTGGACDAGAGCPLLHLPAGELAPREGDAAAAAAAAALTSLPTAPCSRATRLVVHYDSENCAFATAPGALYSAAGVFSALTALLAAATGAAGAAEVRVYHGRALPEPVRVSARTWGGLLVDAGRKDGAVDLALKGGVADALTEHLLARLDAATAAAAAPLPPPPPVVVCIVSGDRDFSDDLRRLRRAGLRTAVVYSATASADYVALADVALPWDAVLALAAATREDGGDAGGGGRATPLASGAASPAARLASSLLRTPAFQRAAAELGMQLPPSPQSQAQQPRSRVPRPGDSAGVAPGAGAPATSPPPPSQRRRQRLPCRFYLAPSGCHDGLRCRFVHLCPAWNGGGGGGGGGGPTAGCAAGDACGLAHGLDDPRLPAGEYACVPAAASDAPPATVGTPAAPDALARAGAMRLTPPMPVAAAAAAVRVAAPRHAATAGAAPSVSGLTDTDDEAASGGEGGADDGGGGGDGASTDSSVTLGYYRDNDDDDEDDDRSVGGLKSQSHHDASPTHDDAANSVSQQQQPAPLPRRAPAFVLPPVRLTRPPVE
jgi:hypothetical protein